MKKIFLYLTLIGLFTFSSCGDDFLDSQPYTELTDENFYKTPQQAYDGLVGIYDGMQRMYSAWNSWVVSSELLSDNMFGGFGVGDDYNSQMLDQFDPAVAPAQKDIMFDNWSNYYAGIYRANVFLSKLDGVVWEEGDTETRAQYEAEARFIRAIAYFDLARMFGNVVLLTEPSAANLPQSTPEEVYTVVVEDLLFAIENLPATPYASQSTSEHGRATRWAAQAMLARVYLYYSGYYGQTTIGGVTSAVALGHLEDLIANSGHGLVSDFATLWPAASLGDYAGERNPENIFNIKYTFTSKYDGDGDGYSDVDGNHWMVGLGLRGSNYTPYGMGWGGGTVNSKLWDAFDDDDTRKTASIISVADEDFGFNNSDQREYTGYYNKKYIPMSDDAGNSLAVALGGVDFQIGQYQDYIMIRYADVLLMAAELGSANAQDYFDAVRERALGEGFVSIPVNKENIMEERRLEFAFEGIRYWDLLRQGVDVAAATIAETTELLNGGVPAVKTIQASRIQATKGLQQIPDREITLSNGTLVQNTGWQ